MRRRSLTLAVAVATMTCGGMLATRADDWKATGEFDWHDTGGKTIEMENGHFYWHWEGAGKFFNDKGSLLDRAEANCIGSGDTDINNKRAKQGGYRVITDTDGDHAYWRWESSGAPSFEVKGTLDFTNGTGKYRGIIIGLSIFAPEQNAKRLDLLHKMVPQARRVGILFDPQYYDATTLQQVEATATQLGLKPFVHSAGSEEETATALAAMLSEHVEAINVLASPRAYNERAFIMERLAKAKVPAIYPFPEAAAVY
jgi:hypothetical protein